MHLQCNTGLENWRDLVYENLKNDRSLHREIVRLLVDGRCVDYDYAEAIYWVDRLNVDRRDVPHCLMEEMGMLSPQKNVEEEEEVWDDGKVNSIHKCFFFNNS